MARLFPLLAGLVLCIPAGNGRAEVDIPLDCRVSNQPPGRCGWCALETVGRHQRIKSLFGLTNNNARQARSEDLEQVLADKGIPFQVQQRGSFDIQILEQAINHNHGVVVGFRELYPGAGGHIVTLIDLDSENVRVIDPNDADHRIRTMSRQRFFHWWDGFALVVSPTSVVAGSE
jgi:ABC-type bacteriocin/lantibiotic exporter with double-glycine peptidase domain